MLQGKKPIRNEKTKLQATMGIITLGFVACMSSALMRLVTTQETCLTVNHFKCTQFSRFDSRTDDVVTSDTRDEDPYRWLWAIQV